MKKTSKNGINDIDEKESIELATANYLLPAYYNSYLFVSEHSCNDKSERLR